MSRNSKYIPPFVCTFQVLATQSFVGPFACLERGHNLKVSSFELTSGYRCPSHRVSFQINFMESLLADKRWIIYCQGGLLCKKAQDSSMDNQNRWWCRVAKWKQFGPYRSFIVLYYVSNFTWSPTRLKIKTFSQNAEAMFPVVDIELHLYWLFASAEWQPSELLWHSLPALTPAFAASHRRWVGGARWPPQGRGSVITLGHCENDKSTFGALECVWRTQPAFTSVA